MTPCPDIDILTPQALALLPRGRAWSTHHGGPWPGSVSYQFWRAVSAAYAFVYARACALAMEFFCNTMLETRPQWLADYGLPNACEPYPDVCTKLAAMGGATCAYYAQVAFSAGWLVTCTDVRSACGMQAGNASVGCAHVGLGLSAACLVISVSLSGSPAYSGPANAPAAAGQYQTNNPRGCAPDISSLQCLLERVIQAQLFVTYEVLA